MSETGDQRRLLDLFDRLLDLPAEERDDWIDRRAAEDAELGRALRALLAEHDAEEGPLDHSPVPAGDPMTAEDVRDRLAEALAGRYELEGELGRGGMAVVFRARELKHDRPVVLKALRPELRPFLGEDRFQREVRIASRMSHPNIIGLIDSGTAAGLPFFVMPFVEGETLRARLDREGPLDRESARSILLGVATGLAHAHQLGIVHRDLKPENVLCAGDHAYIMDFGIARPAGEADRDDLTRPGLAVGTPRYMSPEQQAGEAVDHRTDLYAWGLLAREVTGGEIPAAWVSAVSACLANDPSARPADADVLVRALTGERAGSEGLAALGARAWPWAATGLALA
ncbi:MAG: serine/threonine-protein kinase, partial [Gemmatimonadota bacterium]